MKINTDYVARLMDVSVALQVMGWTREPQTYKDMEGYRYTDPDGKSELAWDGIIPPTIPAYSTNPTAAFLVVDRFFEMGFSVQVSGLPLGGGWMCTLMNPFLKIDAEGMVSPTVAHAIATAAIFAVEELHTAQEKLAEAV